MHFDKESVLDIRVISEDGEAFNIGTKLEKWLCYLKNEGNPEEDETMRILLKENSNLNKAHKKYLSFTMDSELVDAYEAQWKRGYASGVDEALKKERKESKVEIAKNMLDNGSEIAFVSKCTGMTIR